MANKRSIFPFPLMAALLSSPALAQVTLIQQLPPINPNSGFQGYEIDIKNDWLLTGGKVAELFKYDGTFWQPQYSSHDEGHDVAIGDNYFAYAHVGYSPGVPPHIYVHSLAPPFSLITIINTTIIGFNFDEGNHIAFSGDYLGVVSSGNRLDIYDPSTSFSTPQTMTPPGFSYQTFGTIDGDEDEFAVTTVAGEVLVYEFDGISTWGPNPSFTSSMLAVYPDAAVVSGCAMHDDLLMICGSNFNGNCYAQVYRKSGGNWGLDESLSIPSLSTNYGIGWSGRICFTDDQMFINDGSGATPDGVVRMFRNQCGTWNNEITPVIDDGPGSVPYIFGLFGLDADNGFLGIGDPAGSATGSTYLYDACPPDGTTCDTDCNPNTAQEWDDCNCVVVSECVVLEIEYAAGVQAVNWYINGQNFVHSTSGSEGNPPPYTTLTYQYFLPTGAQGAPLNYEFRVDAPAGVVDGWRLRTCGGQVILNNQDDWGPINSTFSGPGELQTTGVGCSNTMIDFQLPLGPLTITSACGEVPMRWSICNETGNNYAATAAGMAGVFYEYQFFDPDGHFSIIPDNPNNCNNNGAVYSRCEKAWTSQTIAGSVSPSSFSTLRVRRGRWLNLRARPVGGNYGEVCYVCFEKTTAPTILCPQLFTGGGGGSSMVLAADHPSFSIRPNPSTDGQVTLDLIDLLPEVTTLYITVMDALGRQVITEQVITGGAEQLSTTLDLGHQAPGLYHVQVSSGERVFTERLVID